MDRSSFRRETKYSSQLVVKAGGHYGQVVTKARRTLFKHSKKNPFNLLLHQIMVIKFN